MYSNVFTLRLIMLFEYVFCTLFPEMLVRLKDIMDVSGTATIISVNGKKFKK